MSEKHGLLEKAWLLENVLRVNGEYKYWIKVSPLARINPEEWLCTIFKKGKVSWITEKCKDGFATPEVAYDWAIEEIKKYLDKDQE